MVNSILKTTQILKTFLKSSDNKPKEYQKEPTSVACNITNNQSHINSHW